MTQSGQGEEPSARRAHEGIVLPSDGGEPLLPGTLNHGGGPTPVPPGGPIPASAPPGAQAWDQPWGPEQPTAPPADQPWPSAQQGQPWSNQPEQTYGPAQPHDGGGQSYDGGAQAYNAGGQAYDAGAQAYSGGQRYNGDGQQQYNGDGQAYGGGQAYGPGGPYANSGPSGPQGQDDGRTQGYGAPQGPSHAGAMPPAQPMPGQGHPGSLPPVQQHGQALPPADEGATQFLPPVPAHGGPGPLPQHQNQHPGPMPEQGAPRHGAAQPPLDEGATQYIPPVQSEGATQFLPPVGPGALPPEVPQGGRHGGGGAQRPAESTTFLGRTPQQPQPHQQPHQQYQGGGPDAEATQFIPPVTDGGPTAPPAEFAGLFRDEPAEGAASSTQQMPRFQQPRPGRHGGGGYAPQPAPSYDGPGGGRGRRAGHDDEGGGGRRGGRTGSKVPLIAAVGVAIAVVGVGAGALMSTGGGEKKEDPAPVSATGPAESEDAASPAADPARAQAVELDKLLADSGDSRSAVISAVASVKSCDNLGKAAKDLRDAAGQRNDLVTRLSGLTVNKLPDHAALTTALTKAWQASASADDHYAAWADEVAADKKKCRKKQAASTGNTQAGNAASGTATTEKGKAAALWNAIAKEYGLTERTPTQL
ncbi:hypothetical protein ACIQAC_28240 [Streptomyces sp. NPDC088387]|uniref:hypothetical protein n=1 Tax=Streptomyces sp. NPDC088387 TaxID=3365859 RepID=UPI00380CCC69